MHGFRLRHGFQRLVLALVLSGAIAAPLAGGSARAALAASGEPAANIPIGVLPSACERAPKGAACTGAVVAALDSARGDLGLGPYVLPANFATLSGAQQILVLSNLDRIAYGLPPIVGISPTLSSADQSAMLSGVDPNPTRALGELATYAWTSNWAGGWANAAYAYYEWMYDDGFGGAETSNVDCASAAASGCWVHRRNVLAFADSGTLALGVAVGTDSHGATSYATTLVWTPGPTWTPYSYTWAQAQTDGAGVPRGAAAVAHASKHHSHRRR